MKDIYQSPSQSAVTLGKQRSYTDIVAFLDNNWSTNRDDTSLSCMKKLDKAFNMVSQKIPTILVGGTNGKSLTMHYTRQLFKEEGVTVGAFFSPHFLSYTERFVCKNETISQKTFTELANKVLDAAQSLNITPSSYEVLTMMALLYFNTQKIDVALLEVNEGGMHNATTICHPRIAAITRITNDNLEVDAATTSAIINDMLGIVQTGTHVVSANQSKIHLQEMQQVTLKRGGTWAMPIRKVAPLAYPFEQLHGRCAALAERIVDIYINTICSHNDDTVVVNQSLVTRKKGRRGRPTLEAKRQAELNPKKTLEQFWQEEHGTLPGRFELLEKEKPIVLLDTAYNLDAFTNLLLGIRLLHYKRPLKGLTFIIGGTNSDLDFNEFFKALRYFFKKTSGHIIVYPPNMSPGHKGQQPWDTTHIARALKEMKLKVKMAKSFDEAFKTATGLVDERHGLIVITGSTSAVADYWDHKGIKKV